MGPRSLSLVSLCLLSASCGGGKPWGGASDALFQVSIIDALLAGDYDGVATLSEVRQHGDFGLGTFDRLDGEMIVLDGTVYQVRGDGTVRVPPMSETTPYAMVTKFAVDAQWSIDRAMTMGELEAELDRRIDNPNIFHAVRIDGVIPRLELRSVNAQEKPYPDILEVAETQSTWTHENVPGTLVGFRSPAYVGTMAVSGYHWHFISDDRTLGGHVLSADVHHGLARIDAIRKWDVRLPESATFDKLDLQVDRSEDLETVERT
ncbi:MAG: acetolactate decarboxylase [Myxococcota bacterium]